MKNITKNIIKIPLLISLLFFLIASLGLGQDDLRFDRISIEQGLSASMVLCVIQDHVGYIWIGTSDGLNKYDGISFTTYRYSKDDSTTLSNNFVTSIEEDKEGRLWVGTEKGLNLYDRTNDRFIRYETDPGDPNRPSIFDISTLKSDTFGNLWIGSRNKGLNVLEAATGRFIRLKKNGGDIPGLAHDGITAIDIDDDGSVWIMCWSSTISIFDWETRSFRHVKLEMGDPGRLVGFIKADEETYWFGTNRGLLICNFAKGEEQLIDHDPNDPLSLPADKVHHLYEDVDGRIWLCTEKGLAIYTPGEDGFSVYQHDPSNPNSISIDLVRQVMEDHTGTFWISTRGKGINLFSPTKYKFHHLTEKPNKPNSLSGNYVYSILVDNDGNLWVGTFEGYLNRIDPSFSQFDAYRFGGSSEGYGINSLLQWSDSEILVAGTTENIHIFDKATETFPVVGRVNDIISDMMRSSSGKLYVALRSNGLKIFELQSDGIYRQTIHFDNSAIYSPRLICLAEYEGFIWAGGEQGLHRFDPVSGRFKTYKADGKAGSLLNDYVLYMTVSKDETLWLGTRGGLSRYQPESDSFETFSGTEGLPNDVIYGILEDNNGKLWLSSNMGLIHWDPVTGSVLKQYLQEDGLQSNEFNTGACYKSDSGTMYFGGVNGVSYFDPEKILTNNTPPPIVLTSFSIFGKRKLFDVPLSELEHVELSHEESYISLEFAALDFISPIQNKYKYRMSGVDLDWVESGNRNFVSYNLNPGNYTFEVLGSNSDGIWNTNGISLNININPPFWDTIWFRAIAIIAFFAMVWGLFIIRTYSVRNQRDTLRREVALRTKDLNNAVSELESFSYTVSHDIRAPLRNLQGFCELLNEDYGPQLGEQGGHYVDRIIENASRMEELIEDILWLSRASKNEMVQVNFDLSTIAEQIVADLKRNSPQRSVQVKIEKNIRVHGDKRLIQLAIENLLGNAWKFTKDKDQAIIELSTAREDGKRILILSDNGIGFDQKFEDKIFEPFQKLHTPDEYEGTGIGLSTVKKVIVRHGGRIWAKSKPGHGSTFKFTLPESTA